MRKNLSIEGLPEGEHLIEDYILDYRPDDNRHAVQIRVAGTWYPVNLDDKQEFLLVATVLQSGRAFVTASGFLRGTR